jgi:hypothetical protein
MRDVISDHFAVERAADPRLLAKRVNGRRDNESAGRLRIEHRVHAKRIACNHQTSFVRVSDAYREDAFQVLRQFDSPTLVRQPDNIGVSGFFRRCELSCEVDTVVQQAIEGDRRLCGC